MIFGRSCSQTFTVGLYLPDRIGAPQSFLACSRVPAISLAHLSLSVCFRHESCIAVQVVSRLVYCTLLATLGNAPPHGVVTVSRGLPALADLNQPLRRVVAVRSLCLPAGFPFGMPLHRIAHLGFHRCACAERCGLGVLDELVVLVVAPDTGLVLAAGAIAHGVVAV